LDVTDLQQEATPLLLQETTLNINLLSSPHAFPASALIARRNFSVYCPDTS
jgi:hypothetical protein